MADIFWEKKKKKKKNTGNYFELISCGVAMNAKLKVARGGSELQFSWLCCSSLALFFLIPMKISFFCPGPWRSTVSLIDILKNVFLSYLSFEFIILL